MKAGVGTSPCAVFSTPARAAPSRAMTEKVLTGGSEDQHRVAERVEPIPLLDRTAVELERPLDTGECHHEREERRARQVEVREQGIHAPELEAGADEQCGPPRQLSGPGDRLDDANRRRPDRENALRRCDPRPRFGFDVVPLPVQLVLLEPLLGDGPKRVQADVERDGNVLEEAEQLGSEVQSGGGRGGRAELAGIHGLVALRVVEGLVDVGRKRRLARGLALELEQPAAVCQRLDEPHGAELLPLPQASRRADEAFPDAVRPQSLDEQHLDRAAGRPTEAKPRRDDPRVVDHRQLAPEDVRQVAKRPMLDSTALAPIHEEPRRIPRLDRMLRHEPLRKVVIEERGVHPMLRVASPPMDDAALKRVQQRLSKTSEARTESLDEALERSREKLEALAASTAELEEALPARVGDAVRDGLRAEVLPVARHIAELRGLFNQANRRLERIEAELLAERKARIDDLALLVELVSSGWRGIDARLARLEAGSADGVATNGHVEKLPKEKKDKTAPAARDKQDEPVERAAAA